MSAAFNRMASGLATQRDLRKRLVDDVSHELNTPLSVIQLEARGLRDGLQTPERASDQIIREVDRLRGLVTDLNSLAETDYGELRLALEATSVFELLTAETRSLAATGPGSRQIELSLQELASRPSRRGSRPDAYEPGRGQRPRATLFKTSEAGGNIVLRAELEGVAKFIGYRRSLTTEPASPPRICPTSSTASTEVTSRIVAGMGGTGLGFVDRTLDS